MASVMLMLNVDVLLLAILTCTVTGQTERLLAYSMYEETPSNTFIADIPRDAQLSLTIPIEDLNRLTYSILPQSGEYTQYFSIGETDGVLRTTQRIDRDRICYQKVTCPLKLDVAVQPREYFRVIKVTIVIEDINDSAPAFLEGHFTRSISENTNPGASFTIPTADDPDSPKYGVKRYELVTGAPQFDLKVTNSSDGTLDLHLVLKEKVDREVRELYRVVVAAYDGGLPPNAGTLTLDIIILDVNDNYPHFDNDTYTVVVPESVKKNAVIIKVRAKDIDAGLNGQVFYSFSTKTLHSYGQIFGINNQTGEIYIKDKLDYEQGSSYTLSVTARDMNPESLTTLAKVIVNVEDVNDHPPQITVNALTTTGYVEISEGESQGSLVAHISVEDPDSGHSGQFSCSLDSSKFTIQQLYGGSEYKIITSDLLDREEEASYQLDFICADNGVPSLTSTAKISVTVLDENDNPPEFSKQTYSTILAENNAIGVSLIQLNATDPDLEQNGLVEYRALGQATHFLDVDPVSGVITAKVSFDYEQAHVLEFSILASDHGMPQKSSTSTLIITFTDEDDSLPEFTSTSYSFDVYENLPLGTEVGQVTAIDADSAPFNEFMYFMDPVASAADAFMLAPESGKIFTRTSLDRETISEYQLVVMAVSKTAPSQSSNVRVFIYVADKNDNSPIVIFPTVHNNTVYLEKALRVGDTISTILISDADIGINSKLTYLITGGNDKEYFAIDQQTGIIFVNNHELLKVSEKIFKLRLMIHDNGSPQKTVDTIMNIVVNKSLADLPISSKQNLTIVVSVIVVSAIITVILIIAIVFIKRRDNEDKKKKLQYSTNIVHQHALVVENGFKPSTSVAVMDANTSTPIKKQETNHKVADSPAVGTGTKRTHDGEPISRREVCFSSKVQVQGEADCALDISVPDWDHQIAEPSHEMPYGSHQSLTSHPTVEAISAHHLALSASQLPLSPRHHAALENAINNIPLTVITDKDSDSAMSNADSGRGSNEDAESRLSPTSPQKNDGILLKPSMVQQPPSSISSNYVHSDSCYPTRYGSSNSVVQHSDSFNDSRSALISAAAAAAARSGAHKQQCTGVHQYPCSERGVPSSMDPNNYSSQPPNYVYMHPNKARFNPDVHHTNPHSAKLRYNHADQSYGSHGHSSNRHSNLDSSYAEESETEYSDEDREYVYYVENNHTASHV